ncbi:OmpA-family protein [Leptospira ryugenii]|uniref:OmpA-family protein n=1 Tax=Leptospira ryugenii TaxID=1917863 RepID=A0A2P2E3U7_9LEPT|nr:OmpA family protein [Leptospira ryugenii]GBF51539.1 OmpA-family protein [Leptospira ryugenii]
MKKGILLTLVVAIGLLAQPLPKITDSYFFGPLNTQNVEYNPIISPTGRYLVFQSNRPGGEGGMDIWVTENLSYPNRMKTPSWDAPKNFRELNTPNFEGMFTVLFDEAEKPYELYFTSARYDDARDRKKNRDGFDGLNIYYTKINPRTGLWAIPLHLNEINSHFEDKMPAVSPDGCYVIFSSNRPGGLGGYDLWISKRVPSTKIENLEPNADKPRLKCRDGVWQRPINLGSSVNGPEDEISPSFHWDGTRLYFSSNRNQQQKKYSFYYSDYDSNSEKYSIPKLMGDPFNTKRVLTTQSTGFPFDTPSDRSTYSLYEESDNEGISVTHDDLWFYFASNRPGGQGQFDIYRTQVPEDLRKSYDFVFRGLVYDGSESIMIGLDATLKIFDETKPIGIITSKRIGGDLSTEENENFRTNIRTGKFYRVEISSPGFIPTELNLDLRGNVGEKKEQYSRIKLLPIKEEKPDRPDMTIKGIRFVVKDKKTNVVIPNADCTYFDDINRKGKVLTPKDNQFDLTETPNIGFEILVKAKGYKTDTFLFPVQRIQDMVGKETVLYLRNLNDYDDLYNTVIYFPFNQRSISDEDKKILDRFAEYLIKNKNDIVEIGGHTDNVGSKEYNITLSEDRALAVYQYLREKGVAKEKMKIQAYHYSQPLTDNDTEEGRAKNRRVNFKKVN